MVILLPTTTASTALPPWKMSKRIGCWGTTVVAKPVSGCSVVPSTCKLASVVVTCSFSFVVVLSVVVDSVVVDVVVVVVASVVEGVVVTDCSVVGNKRILVSKVLGNNV